MSPTTWSFPWQVCSQYHRPWRNTHCDGCLHQSSCNKNAWHQPWPWCLEHGRSKRRCCWESMSLRPRSFASKSRPSSLWPPAPSWRHGSWHPIKTHAPFTPNFPIPTGKWLGIIFINRCWHTTLHTITIGDADGWCLPGQPWIPSWGPSWVKTILNRIDIERFHLGIKILAWCIDLDDTVKLWNVIYMLFDVSIRVYHEKGLPSLYWTSHLIILDSRYSGKIVPQWHS